MPHASMASVRLHVLLSVLLMTVFAAVPAAGQNYCLGANPNDALADDAELQACLNGGGLILLSSGNPGYILASGLRLRASGTALSSLDTNNRARLVADPTLNGVMLLAEADAFELSFLIFDGNRYQRTNTCTYPNGHNLLLYGNNFVVRFVDSSFARCGSAMEVVGSGMEIYNNTFAHNGWSADERSGEWADGITIHRCDGSSIRSNQVVENTDVGIVVNEGFNCQIRFNHVWNYERYAFAGLHVSAGYRGGVHNGSQYSDNVITSGFDRLGFGLIVGAEQWHGTRTADVGYTVSNFITGAVINLAVDGVDGGRVTENQPANPQGTRGLGTCYGQPGDNFAAIHNGPGLILQPGWVTRGCH